MMTHREALEVLAANRRDQVVVTTMGSVAVWPLLSDAPRDFHYLPSSMGQGVPLGLGLCLAKPGLGVVVLTGDGGLLMNLGCLVTAAQHPVPLFVVLIDNGLYEVTGGQDVAGAGKTDFAAIARGAGFGRVYAFDTLDGWKNRAAECLSGSGPVFVWLKVKGDRGKATPTAPRPMAEQIARLRAALGVIS
jgi:thiamine pyrophosphate-dependent acetolactate synthase large subunit-like protein